MRVGWHRLRRLRSLSLRSLREFGPQRQSYHPEFPFWRLQNDGDFWDVPERDTVHRALGDRQGGDVPKSILRDHGVSGGFSTDVDAYLRQHPELVNQLAARLLEEHFPGTYTDDLLNAVGMPFVVEPRAGRRPRDPGFRDHILRIYSYRCAVCGYDGRLGHAVLGVEAADNGVTLRHAWTLHWDSPMDRSRKRSDNGIASTITLRHAP